jgi:hypothetical protein
MIICAKIDQKLLWTFASALGPDLLAAPTDAVPDAAFTADRAQLQARLGGAGVSLFSNCYLYVNMLTTTSMLTCSPRFSRSSLIESGWTAL